MAQNFGPAFRGEEIVFGASRPGYPAKDVPAATVDEWLSFMSGQGIERVVCLLPESQLAYYATLPQGLLGRYREVFGEDNVLPAPIEDFELSSPENLSLVINFLTASAGRPTVIHCSGGSGRTGHVLAAWLVHSRCMDPEQALNMVQQTKARRNPLEAVGLNGATEQDLVALLEAVRPS